MKTRKRLYALAVLTAAGVFTAMPAYAREIPDGVYVGDISLGGMTEAEAEQAIDEHVKGMAARKVVFDVEGQQVETTAAELGFSWSNRQAVEEAAGHAVGGNLIERYMGRKDLEKNPVHIPLETTVDEAMVENFIVTSCEGMVAEPQDATITRVDGQFQITPGTDGKMIDVAATKASIDQALKENNTGDISIDASVTVREPEVTEEDLATIEDVLGTCSTDFSSSGSARSKNLSVGTSKINGRVLMPGETLSGYECMSPLTVANGYHTAASYENGQVVDSVGGGVCQIATTLYNAALRAELEITQRQNHSMIVTYVKPSMDAAIAGTYKDIKITNNYSTPIYVEGQTSGRTLTFTIYGQETRPENRTVEYISETLSVTDPGAPIERPDNSLAPGTRRQVQSSHRGIRSRLWKVVKVDGMETERSIVSTDSYNASKAIVLVGPALPVESQPVETQPVQPPQELEPVAIEGIEGGPGVSGAAAPSPAQPAPSSGEAAPSPSDNAPGASAAPAAPAAPVVSPQTVEVPPMPGA